jgi:hypothetical protein
VSDSGVLFKLYNEVIVTQFSLAGAAKGVNDFNDFHRRVDSVLSIT